MEGETEARHGAVLCCGAHGSPVAFPRLRPFPPPPCRYLSHTELAPLRAPLIPMEHCTTRFFETCDLDNDKYIALDEWAGCFGIKERECQQSGGCPLSPVCPSSLPGSALSA